MDPQPPISSSWPYACALIDLDQYGFGPSQYQFHSTLELCKRAKEGSLKASLDEFRVLSYLGHSTCPVQYLHYSGQWTGRANVS